MIVFRRTASQARRRADDLVKCHQAAFRTWTGGLNSSRCRDEDERAQAEGPRASAAGSAEPAVPTCESPALGRPPVSAARRPGRPSGLPAPLHDPRAPCSLRPMIQRQIEKPIRLTALLKASQVAPIRLPTVSPKCGRRSVTNGATAGTRTIIKTTTTTTVSIFMIESTTEFPPSVNDAIG